MCARRVDLPALGRPTMPTSAMSLSSRRSQRSSPGSPFSAMRGAWFVGVAVGATTRHVLLTPEVERSCPAVAGADVDLYLVTQHTAVYPIKRHAAWRLLSRAPDRAGACVWPADRPRRTPARRAER